MEDDEAEGFAAHAARGVAAALGACDVDRATRDAVLRLAVGGPGGAPSAPGAAGRVLAALREPAPWCWAVAAARAVALRARRRGGAPLARALVLGDVHGEHVALARALARFCGEVDGVLAVGDFVDGGPGTDVGRSIELLAESEAACVAGNHERWWLAGDGAAGGTPQGSLASGAVAWLRALPRWRTVETVAGRAALAHGFVDDDMAFVPRDVSPRWLRAHRGWAPLVASGAVLHVGGHTHAPFVVRVPGEPAVTLLNVGTLQRGGRAPAVVAIVDFEARLARFHPLDVSGTPSETDAWEVRLPS